MNTMSKIFPEPILKLPEVLIPVNGVTGYLSQGENEQIIFMEFGKNAHIPEHAHESQWEIVLEGCVDLQVGTVKKTYGKGERFFIPKGIKHSADVYAGYSAIVFFHQKDRYEKKK